MSTDQNVKKLQILGLKTFPPKEEVVQLLMEEDLLIAVADAEGNVLSDGENILLW